MSAYRIVDNPATWSHAMAKKSLTREVLFVQGVQKTGTSTLVGMLNCHPEIFVLYETQVSKGAVSKYGNQLLNAYPQARKYFRRDIDIARPYRDLFDYLEDQSRGVQYRFVGDKIIDVDPSVTQKVRPERVIFTLRDISSWLCKEQIVKYYRSDLDVVAAAIDYLKYVVGTHRYAHCHRIWLEDLVEHNQQTIEGISSFLGMDLGDHLDSWWEKIGNYDDSDPKKVVQWYAAHHSSKQPPKKLDTSCRLVEGPFWDEVFSILEPYRNSRGKHVCSRIIDQDLKRIESLYCFSPLTHEDCYHRISTIRLGKSTPLEQPQSKSRSVGNGNRWRRFASRFGFPKTLRAAS